MIGNIDSADGDRIMLITKHQQVQQPPTTVEDEEEPVTDDISM